MHILLENTVDRRRENCVLIVDLGLLLLQYLSIPWFVAAPRLLASILMLVVSLQWFRRLRGKGGRPVLLWLLSLLSTLLPVDISFHNSPGPPRFVPLVMGLPDADAELMAQAGHGDILWGGCIATGYEARWVLVW